MMKMQIVTTNSEFLRKPLQRTKLFLHSLQTMILIRINQVLYPLLTEKMYYKDYTMVFAFRFLN